MDRKELKELYEIYKQNNNTNLFSRFSFNRKMKSPEITSAISNIRDYLNLRGMTQLDASKAYLNLNKWLSTEEISNMFAKQTDDIFNDSNIEIGEKIATAFGFDKNSAFALVNDNFINIALTQDKDTLQNLFQKYIPTIFEMHLRSDEGFFLYDDMTQIAEDHYTLEGFKSLLNSNSPDAIFIKRLAQLEFGRLTKAYSFEELRDKQEMINNDIKLGLDKKILNCGPSSIYLKNLEDFRALAPYIDDNILESIEHSNEYVKQLENLINSGRFSGDELSRLIECKDTLSKLDISKPKELLSLFKNNPELAENIHDAVLDYEVTYREDIVNNITEVHPERVQQIEVKSAVSPETKMNINGILVDSLEKLGNPLIHMFNKKEASSMNVALYISQKAIEKSILDRSMDDSQLKDFITKLYDVVSNSSSSWRNPNERYDESKAYKEIMALIPEKDKEYINQQAKDYYTNISNPAKINQLDTLDETARKKITELVDSSISLPLTINTEEVPLCTMVMKMRNANDIKKYEEGIALIFDKNGITPEDIILSSRDNLEINNHSLSTLHFDYIRDVKRSSAGLTTLQLEDGISDMTRRTNNEVDLNRANIKPSGILYFGSRTLTPSAVDNLSKALETSEELGIPLVFVDSDSLKREFDERRSLNQKRENVER